MNKWKEFNNLNPKPKVSEFAQELFDWNINEIFIMLLRII